MGARETEKLRDYPLLDWLRFSLAVTVAASHSGLIPWMRSGNLAVQVFFALSGWLIGTILIEMRGNKLPLFFYNRATRVWLPYAVTVTLLYAVSMSRDPITARWFEFLAYDVTFTHDFFTLKPTPEIALAEMPLRGTGAHFWSLAVEEQFYLLAPLIILFVPGGRSTGLWIVLAALLIAERTLFGAIALGVTAAAFQHRNPGFALVPGVRRALWAMLAVAGVLLAYDRAYEFAAPFFAVAVVLLAAVPKARGRLGVFAGGISYPLYLNHWIGAFLVHAILKRAGGASVQFLSPLLDVMAGIAVGAAAYLMVDRPVLARRAAWYTPARGRILGATAYGLVAAGLVVGIVMGRAS